MFLSDDVNKLLVIQEVFHILPKDIYIYACVVVEKFLRYATSPTTKEILQRIWNIHSFYIHLNDGA
jgi:hypothetical protein